MDPVIHVTVPFPMLAEEDVVPLLAALGVGPEIHLCGNLLSALPPGEAEAAAERLAAAGIRSSTFHAPFEELWPGSRDEEVRRLCLRRWRQAIALAPLFRPAGIVVHGAYSDWMYDFVPDRWLETATRSFSEIAEDAERAGVDLFVENVFDEVPDHLLRLRERVGFPRLGFCLDPGHASLFSKVPLHKWVEAFAPHLREVHVHDNRGRRDDHLPVGEGSINFRGLLLAVSDAGATPLLTVEAHRRSHVLRAVPALREILAGLGPSR